MKADLKLQNTAPYFERIRQIPDQRVQKNIFLALLIFLCGFVLAIIAEGLLTIPSVAILFLTGNGKSENALIIVELYLTLAVTIVIMLFSKFCEKRPVSTLFLTRRKLIPDYLLGAVLGWGMMAVIVLAAWGFGALKYEGMPENVSPVIMIVMFIGWILQGFSEEITCRGVLMSSVGTYHSPWTAVLINSAAFGLMHLGNNGFSLPAVINLFLFGVVASLFVLRTGSIWGAAAMHSIWNWAQGNFFGMQVSGLSAGDTIFRFSQTGDAQWIGGGAFGLEAGAATTVVLLIAVVILLLLPQRTLTDKGAETNDTV